MCGRSRGCGAAGPRPRGWRRPSPTWSGRWRRLPPAWNPSPSRSGARPSGTCGRPMAPPVPRRSSWAPTWTPSRTCQARMTTPAAWRSCWSWPGASGSGPRPSPWSWWCGPWRNRPTSAGLPWGAGAMPGAWESKRRPCGWRSPWNASGASRMARTSRTTRCRSCPGSIRWRATTSCWWAGPGRPGSSGGGRPPSRAPRGCPCAASTRRSGCRASTSRTTRPTGMKAIRRSWSPTRPSHPGGVRPVILQGAVMLTRKSPRWMSLPIMSGWPGNL